MSTLSSTARAQSAFALVIAVFGIAGATIGAMYIKGMFGLSAAFASQIINAVIVGGWALAAVTAVLSGGFAAVVIGTARWAISRWGAAAAAA